MATNRIGFWTWIWSTRHCDVGQEVACWFQCWKNSPSFVWLAYWLITLVLLVRKWMGLFLKKNHLLRCWGWLSPLNWIGALTLSLLLKLPPRKLEPWFVLWCFFLLKDSYQTKLKQRSWILVKLNFWELCDSKLSGLCTFGNMVV